MKRIPEENNEVEIKFDRRPALWLIGDTMKTKLLTAVCVLTICLGSATSGFADGTGSPGAVVADVVVVRPLCLAVTVVGAAFFVVSLPVAAIAKSVKSSWHTLVVKPAQATFTRPLGDLDALSD